MRKFLLFGALAALQFACGGSEEPPTAELGQVTIRAAELAGAGSVTRVVVELQPVGVTNELLDDGNGGWTGTIVSPIGTQTLTVRAYAGSSLVAQGSATVLVAAGQTATAHVTLLDVTGPPPAADAGPIIRALTSTTTTLAPGARATLSVDAVDPDGDPLAYAWTGTCSTGAFSASDAATTEFWSDVQAGCTVTVTVTSGAFSATRSLTVVVQGAEVSGQVEVSASFAPQPYVDIVYVHGAEPPDPFAEYMISRTRTSFCTYCYLTRNASIPVTYYPGQQQGLTVYFGNLPADPNNDPDLRVWMDDDCGGSTSWGGTIYNGMNELFTWTAPEIDGLCHITAHIEHAGMSDSLTLTAYVTGCTDDQYEQNDTAATATELPPLWPGYSTQPFPEPSVPAPSLVLDGLSANDVDWYTLEVNAPFDRVSVIVTSADAIPLEVYAADGSTLVASGTNSLDATLTPNTIHLLKVGPGGSAAACSSSYAMELWVPVP